MTPTVADTANVSSFVKDSVEAVKISVDTLNWLGKID